ncbi:MAG: 50S ribosomal protein L18 [Candidatus Micrarchaeota archaeon]|nr:50S ribosomal protein L18 [Candidatus Micrarchaeota archaeon]
MMKTVKEVKFRRRREGVTDYRKRLALVKGGLERVVVRKTNKRVMGQVVKYDEKGDRIVASAESGELAAKYGWPSRSNRPTAYLTGLLLAKKAKHGGELILDIGITTPIKGAVAFAFAKGCVDGGMKLKGSFDIKEETYNASQTAKYAEQLKAKPDRLKKQFGGYTAANVQPEALPKLFNEVKEKILKGS